MPELTVQTRRPLNAKGIVVISEAGTITHLPVSPSKWEFKEAHRWGQVEREGHKTVSRRRGAGLRSLDFSILVAALDTRTSIEPQVQMLTGWAAWGTVVRLKGGSPTYQGTNWWYVKDFSMAVTRLTPEGMPTQATLSFSLEEYINPSLSVIKPPPPPPPKPRPTAPQPAPVRAPVYRYHTTVRDDWLSKLAIRYLGRMERWPEIYALNRSAIGSNPNMLRVGLRLKIPPK